MSTDAGELVAVLDLLGYSESYREQDVSSPAGPGSLEVVAYFQEAPRDLRTSAIACDASVGAKPVAQILDLARGLATPFALILEDREIALFSVASESRNDKRLTGFARARPEPSEAMVRALSPEAIRAAKHGTRQLSLFPIDVTLLDRARRRSVETLTTRVQETYVQVHEDSDWDAGEVARLVIGALAAVIVRDKYRISASSSSALVDSVIARHGSYFEYLASVETSNPDVVALAIDNLAEGFDYSAVDARTINRVYENLLVTPEVRKALGIFYTPPEFATRVLAALPIETIEPERRSVFDPSCGSGNLLLAAIERLELLMPGGWSPSEAHAWLNTHISGCDVDAVATEIARLSMLVSSLPLGNNWAIDNRDFINDPPQISPSVIVSNPPWRNPTGSRNEAATTFLARSLGLLSDGGLLACVLPATWLSNGAARESREELARLCEVFEVWRLPRDVFEEARYGTAVVFCRKAPTAVRRSHYAFRWVAAGAARRRQFLDDGTPTASWLASIPEPGSPLVAGPIDTRATRRRVARLRDVAVVTSGVVQQGTPQPVADGRFLALPRGIQYEPYSTIDARLAVPVNSGEDIGPGNRDLLAFHAPQLLVQAHRNPDTAWRVRPVLDLVGVVPSNAWHAVAPNEADEDAAFALLALLASSIASVWVHSRVATKNIPKSVLEEIPLPDNWGDLVGRFSSLGRQLVTGDARRQVLRDIEVASAESYRLTRRERTDVERLMSETQAPEGHPRFEPVAERTSPRGLSRGVEHRPGAVLGVHGSKVQLWVLGGPDEGRRLDLPHHLPGWLAAEGSVFDVEGSDLAAARYLFHRAAYRGEDELFGLNR
jgi:hypothetical protein